MKKTVLLTLLSIPLLIGVTTLKAQTLAASYPFNGNANDVVGTSNGTVNGATITTDRFGNANSAYNFDGIDDYIEADADNLPTGNHSVSLWFKADAGSINAKPGLLGYGGNGGACPGNSFFMSLTVSGGISAFVAAGHCGSNQIVYNYPVFPEEKWYNWVVTTNGTTIKMYVNGVLINTNNTNTQAKIVAGKKLNMGVIVSLSGTSNYTDPNVGRFKGVLDDIKIYNGTLTDAQIENNYLSESLAASYPFNGNATDATGNTANNGTVNGATITTDRFGNANSAYSFDGLNNHIIGSAANYPTGDRTVSIWFNADPGSLASGVAPLSYGGSAGCGSSFLMILNNLNNGKYQTQGHCTSNLNETNYSATPEGNWYNWVTTYNGTTTKMYINGVLINTTNTYNSTTAVVGTDFIIGGLVNNDGIGLLSGYRFKGKLDDIKIYTGALTDAQIFDSYINDLKRPGSGNGLQLTRTGAIATDPWVNIGSGYDFGTQPFTYETWVKRDDLHTTLNDFGIVLLISEPNNGWGIGISNGNNLFFTKTGVTAFYSNGTIADTKWHHVAVVYTGTQIQFYIDGMAAGISSYTDNFNSGGNYTIGARQSFGNSNGDQTINGLIDETRIWRNVALTQTEIRDWMCKKINSTHPAFTNLTGYFRFDEGTSLTTGGYNSKFGVLINTPTWQTSGAALGDAAAHDYINATKTANISHASGENFSATSTSGSPAGIQVYRVDEQPNTLNGATGVGGNHKYFGVFQAGGTTPQYTAVYDYNGNPYVNAGNESGLRLYRRNDNAGSNWSALAPLPNEPANTITVTGESTEYILGTIGTPLPLTLLSFAGSKCSNAICLLWVTENEENFSKFEVEKSADGRNFVYMADIMARNSTGTNSYNSKDNNPFAGDNFYRLKIINTDGSSKYSKVIKISLNKPQLISVLPNPASTVLLVNGIENYTQLHIMDLTGKTLLQKAIQKSQEEVDVNSLRAGLYFIKLSNGTEFITLKFIKQ